MKVPPRLTVGSVGACIYCRREPNGDEHIIPFAFGGHRVLEAASCAECAVITSAMEGQCCEGMFRALRVHQQVPTRRPGKRPTTLRVIDGKEPHGAPVREVPVDEAPGAVVFPLLPPPGILLGSPPTDSVAGLGYAVMQTTDDAVERQRKLEDGGFSGALATAEVPLWPFMRVLAKIARGYDVSQVGVAQSDQTLNPYILGTDNNLPYLVGGTPLGGPLPNFVPEPSDASELHQLRPVGLLIDGVSFIAVQIRLFSQLRPLSPVYTVVMREHPRAAEDEFFRVTTKHHYGPAAKPLTIARPGFGPAHG